MTRDSEDAFERHMAVLLAILEEVRGRTAKPHGPDSRSILKMCALSYYMDERPTRVPTADLIKPLFKLRKALREARSTLEDVIKGNHFLYLNLFSAWCDEQIDPDLQDEIIEDQLNAAFHKLAAAVDAGMAALETAAFRAAGNLRKRPGRPSGTGILPPGFIIELESAYRYITGKPGGAGPGPFARFVRKFLEALGRTITEESVIEAIKAAKKRKEWGRPLFARSRGKTPSNPR
jgi:hypothetical protein